DDAVPGDLLLAPAGLEPPGVAGRDGGAVPGADAVDLGGTPGATGGHSAPHLPAVRRVAAAVCGDHGGDPVPPAFAQREHGPAGSSTPGAGLSADLRGAALAHTLPGAGDRPHPLGDGDLLHVCLR